MSALSASERVTRAFLRTLEQAGLALGGLNAAGRARAALETALAQGAREPLWPPAAIVAIDQQALADLETKWEPGAALLINSPLPMTFVDRPMVDFQSDEVTIIPSAEPPQTVTARVYIPCLGDVVPPLPTDDTAAIAEGRIR